MPIAEKARDYLIDNSVDDDGDVMYNLYSKNRTLKREKFPRDISIAVERLAYFLVADKLRLKT